MAAPILSLRGINKSFGPVQVLRDVDFDAYAGKVTALVGDNGAGKSTLLYQMSMLDRPTSGEIIIDGVDVLALTDQQKSSFRLKELGYVFQDYALLPDLTALENVALPLLKKGENKKIGFLAALEI